MTTKAPEKKEAKAEGEVQKKAALPAGDHPKGGAGEEEKKPVGRPKTVPLSDFEAYKSAADRRYAALERQFQEAQREREASREDAEIAALYVDDPAKQAEKRAEAAAKRAVAQERETLARERLQARMEIASEKYGIPISYLAEAKSLDEVRALAAEWRLEHTAAKRTEEELEETPPEREPLARPGGGGGSPGPVIQTGLEGAKKDITDALKRAGAIR